MMQIILDDGYNGITPPGAVALGNFDGVHLGHQHLIKQMLQIAEEKSMASVVCTFTPHPEKYYGYVVPMISTQEQKLRLLSDLGVDYCFQAVFNCDFAELCPQSFMEGYLVKRLKAKAIIVGDDFKFGKNRQGNAALLKEFCSANDITLKIIPRVELHGAPISSTSIRKLVADAKISDIPAYLGRYLSCVGTVEHGQKIGAKIGFPTANLKLNSELIPPDGVYSGYLDLDSTRYLAMIYSGTRPTVSTNTERRFEVNIIGYSGDLYERELEVYLTSFVRGDKKFASVDELKAQIRNDRQTVIDLKILP